MWSAAWYHFRIFVKSLKLLIILLVMKNTVTSDTHCDPHPKKVRVAIATLRGDAHGSATATTHPRVTGRSSHYVEASPHPQRRREAATKCDPY